MDIYVESSAFIDSRFDLSAQQLLGFSFSTIVTNLNRTASWGIWNFHRKLRFSLPQREEKGGATQNDQELGKFRKNKQKISPRSSAWKTLERFDSNMCNRLVHEKIISGKAAASARKERRKRMSGSSGKFVSLLGKILRKLSWLLMEIVITHRKFHIYSQRRLYFPPSTTTTVVHARYRPYITQTAAAQQQHIHMSISVVLKWWFGIFLAEREEREPTAPLNVLWCELNRFSCWFVEEEKRVISGWIARAAECDGCWKSEGRKDKLSWREKRGKPAAARDDDDGKKSPLFLFLCFSSSLPLSRINNGHF